MAKKYYVIKKGTKTGIFFDEWENVKPYILGFKGAEYKGFDSKDDAAYYFSGAITQQKLDNIDVEIYCDGSFDISRPENFGSGAVILKDGVVLHELSLDFSDKAFAATRNVAGEVMAVLKSLEYCIEQKLNNIMLYVDYQGLISWWDGSWETKSDVSIFYKGKLNIIKDKLNFTFTKVDAHTGVKYNDRADILAKQAQNKCKIN